jgi:small subunit ribosomal protein S6
LTLLLDLSATDEARAKIVADTRAAIESEGTLIGHHAWGQRALAYPIERHESAEYHLFQLHPTNALLENLNRTLRITDGVLRHRIIKLAPGTPPLADGRPATVTTLETEASEEVASAEPAA